jgi:uncharacterized repeat protein (TIGR01451 family)
MRFSARVRLAIAVVAVLAVMAPASASAAVNTLSIAPASGSEAGFANFTVTLLDATLTPIPALADVPFTFSTASGSAASGSDFAPVSIPTVIPTGLSSVTIPVFLSCDYLTEGTETLTASITAVLPITVPTATGTIFDTCQGPLPPFFPGTADLQITATSLATSVPLGQTATYDLLVSNLGPGAAQNVTVFDSLPGATSLSGLSPGLGFCTGTTCNLGTVLAGQSVPIRVTWLSGALGTLVNSATVSSSTFDPNSLNNAASAVTGVVASGTGGVLPVVGGATGSIAPLTGSSSSTSSDTAAPGMELHYDRACHLLDDRVCILDVRTGEDSRVRIAWNAIIPAFGRTARASRVVRFRTISRSLAADDSREIGLRPSRRVRLLIAGALAHGVPVTGRFRITATDAEGNARTLRRSFRIVR